MYDEQMQGIQSRRILQPLGTHIYWYERKNCYTGEPTNNVCIIDEQIIVMLLVFSHHY